MSLWLPGPPCLEEFAAAHACMHVSSDSCPQRSARWRQKCAAGIALYYTMMPFVTLAHQHDALH